MECTELGLHAYPACLPDLGLSYSAPRRRKSPSQELVGVGASARGQAIESVWHSLCGSVKARVGQGDGRHRGLFVSERRSGASERGAGYLRELKSVTVNTPRLTTSPGCLILHA